MAFGLSARASFLLCHRFENPLAGIRQRTHRERRRQATGVGFSDASVVTVTSGVPGPIVGAGLPVVTAVCHRGNHSPLSPCSRLHCSARRRTLASACMRSNACCRDEGALRHGDAAASMALIMVLRSRALEMSMLRCLARRRISGVLTRRSSSPILSFLKGQLLLASFVVRHISRRKRISPPLPSVPATTCPVVACAPMQKRSQPRFVTASCHRLPGCHRHSDVQYYTFEDRRIREYDAAYSYRSRVWGTPGAQSDPVAPLAF